MTPRRPLPDLSDLYDFFNAFHAENDLAAAILSGALLDELLKRMPTAAFLEEAAPNLLSERGALGTFGAKIDVAYALGSLTSVGASSTEGRGIAQPVTVAVRARC